ncbi:hypothetical protein PLICRDRAFT_104569 [Plicaturopsis crispa FD-325 SS-3]|nr:hypothetical protein PLICRDRAFT_104569 [Plicaturopsis crispa FD-325 SS-3]
MSGFQLFQRAETAYHSGDTKLTFSLYAQSIRKIIRSEDVAAKFPASIPLSMLPPDSPHEVLGTVWRNFVGFFRDANLHFTQETNPDEYKLLHSFRPSAKATHPEFTSPRAKVLLKGMQITAALTLGLMAWDKRDRATAAKRYEEGLVLAATHAPFMQSDAPIGLERYVSQDIQDTRKNLGILTMNDAAYEGADGVKRKDVVRGVPQIRLESDGRLREVFDVVVATDACRRCATRGAKLRKCSRCKEVSYCGEECQKADWTSHKQTCKKSAS